MRCIGIYILILLNLYIPTYTKVSQEQLLYVSKGTPQRLLLLMENYAARADLRIDEILFIRGKYEASPHFEYGYVISEILERYRKIVGITQRPLIFRSDAVFDTIKRAELVQKLFLDILHLANMFHEIPQKYIHKHDFFKVASDVDLSLNIIQESKKYREWVKKKHQKEIKKEKELIKKGEMKLKPITKRPNKWWPLDYGWEIDYQWW